MKVVLFCGGLGTRLREHSDTIPKPLVNVGYRPLIWHLMRYYAHYGHKEFILCLGYRGYAIREYFLQYQEALSVDFTLSDGGKHIELHSKDISDWKITFLDTGLHSNIGQRLLHAKRYLEGEEMFMANYSDGLSDLPLVPYQQQFEASKAVASFVSVRGALSFHAVESAENGQVTSIKPVQDAELWVNGGFFIFRRSIFDYIKEGEELVEEPFQRLIEQHRLMTLRYPGFWKSMDTFKDKITFDRMEAQGSCPWMVWRS